MTLKCKNWMDLLGKVVIIIMDIYYMLSFSFIRTKFFPHSDWFVYFAVVIFSVYLILNLDNYKSNRRELILTGLFLSIGALSGYITREFTLLISAICIVASVRVERTGLFKCLFWEKLFFLVANFLLSTLGIIDTCSRTYQRRFSLFGNGEVFRRSLGFSHYNALGATVFSIITLYILSKERKLTKIQYVILLAIAILAYIISGSRTPFISELLLLFFIKASDWKQFKKKVVKVMIMIIMIGGSLFCSIGIKILYEFKYEWFSKINRLLQGRFLYAIRYLEKFGISILGNNTKDLNDFWGKGAGAAHATLDSGYATMMIKYGIVVTVLIIAIYYIYLFRGKWNVRNYVLCIILVVSIYNFVENELVFFSKNISLFFLADVIGKKNCEDHEIIGITEAARKTKGEKNT